MNNSSTIRFYAKVFFWLTIIVGIITEIILAFVAIGMASEVNSDDFNVYVLLCALVGLLLLMLIMFFAIFYRAMLEGYADIIENTYETAYETNLMAKIINNKFGDGKSGNSSDLGK